MVQRDRTLLVCSYKTQSQFFCSTYETLAVAANVNIEEILKLALDWPQTQAEWQKEAKQEIFLHRVCVLGTDDQEDKKR